MHELPRFYYNGQLEENNIVSLDADTAKHIWQVLRMDTGDRIMLTDGKGHTATGSIHTAERHKCSVSLEQVTFQPRRNAILHLGVGFTKNNSRNEWLLEKATELGVGSIIPIMAARSEKTHFRHDRWVKIIQSAVLQSQQYYMPDLADSTPLHKVLKQHEHTPLKLVAHCISDISRSPLSEMLKPASETLLLIGPEGDFTREEVNLCIENGCKPVSLGTQRLRTETAAITAAAFFNVMYNDE